MTASLSRASLRGPGLQIVHITVRDGYRPRTIVARAGLPLRLVFHRDEDTPCSERVVFSSPHLDRHLAPHGATVIELPAQAPGEVRFTCAMGRYRGLIRLREEKPVAQAKKTARARRLRAGIATSLLVLLVSGSLVAVAPGLGATPLVAGFVLVVLDLAVTLGTHIRYPLASADQPRGSR
ncbi:MAG: cupredoxin domain-containing protein [Chloroflexi bacterium]|nr:cupredoxin domain-containing protein [Chloroflexota bacterium]